MVVDAAQAKMSVNAVKRSLRRLLPGPLFRLLRGARALCHRPSTEVDKLKQAFDERQTQCNGPEEIALRSGLVLKLSNESREPFEWFCWRSPPMVGELDAFINYTRGAKSFVDVGASHGIFSLAFLTANPDASVIAIDPSPSADRIRKVNTQLNGFDENLLSVVTACGSCPGSVRMRHNWHHMEAINDEDACDNFVEVPVETLDSICASHAFRPEIVKIDVEGFELEVLRGSEGILSTARLLFLEVHPELLEHLKASQSDIHNWLSIRGWKVQTPEGERLSLHSFADRIHTFWTVCERI